MKILIGWLAVQFFILESFGQTGPSRTTCRPIADVVFLMDGSDSISDDEFYQQKELIERFVQLSDISPDTVRVGVVVVSSAIGDSVPLAARSNRTLLTSAVTSLSQPMEGSRIDIGLTKMEQMFGTDGRPGVVRIGVVMSDGRAKFARATQGEADVVKNAGVFLVAIGAGRLIQFQNLEAIASTRSNAYPLLPLDISTKMLTETVKFLGQETCSGHALLDQLSTSGPHVDPAPSTTAPTTRLPPVRHQQQQQQQQKQQLIKLPHNQVVPPQNAIIIPQQVIAPQQMIVPEQAINPRRSLFESQSDPRFSMLTKFDLSSLKGVDLQSIVSPLDMHSANFTLISRELAKDAAQRLQPPAFGLAGGTTPTPTPTTTDRVTTAPKVVPNVADPATIIAVSLPGQSDPRTQGDMSQNLGMKGVQDLYKIFNMGSFKFEGKRPESAMANKPIQPAQRQMNVVDTATTDIITEISKPITSFAIEQAAKAPADIAASQATRPVPNEPQKITIATSNQAAPGKPVDPAINLPNEPWSNLLARPLTITPKETVITPVTQSRDSLSAQALINLAKQPLTKFLTDSTANFQQQAMLDNMLKESAINDPKQSVSAINVPRQSVADLLKDSIINLAKQPNVVQTAKHHSTVHTSPTTAAPGGPTSSTYIHGIHRELAAHQCSKARNIDGVGYTFHPKSCTEFLQCFQQDGGLHVEIGKCPFETFFDEELAVCRYHTQVNCFRDPCSDTDVISYKHSENCRSYWDCGTGKSKPKCCPYGSSYSPGYGCIRNTTCEDMCMDFGNLNMVVAASKCKHLAMESDPKYYFESVAGVGWVIRTCPYGSRFQQPSCKCRIVTEVTAMSNNCNPELYLDFQGGVEDKSGNGLSLGNTNVELEAGTGVFDGNSLLKLWRFSGVSFGQKVTVTFRFRVSVTAPKGKLMHLMSNCCYGCRRVPTPSIDIAIIPGHNGGIGVFSASTEAAGEIFVYVPYEDTITGWNRLTYTYNGRELTGKVNGAENRKQIIGDVEARSDPLTIGACNKDGAFQGYLDEVKFYLCDI